jgi:hypothetical protein
MVDNVDADGFVHCPNHPGYRRMGWRSRRKNKHVAGILTVDWAMPIEESEKSFWQEMGIILTKDAETYRIVNPSLIDGSG